MLIRIDRGFSDVLKHLSKGYIVHRNFIIPGFGGKGSGRKLHYTDKRVLG